MNSSELHRLLCQGPQPFRIAETKQKCAALLQENPVRHRTGFWTFLSQVWRFTGAPMWAAQGAASLLFFLAAAGQKDLVSWLPLLGPLLVGVCLPVLFAGQRFDMDELEASTCVSCAELALAKLILAAAADLVFLTAALALGKSQTGKALLPLFFYLLVPFLFCALTSLTVLRRCPRSNGVVCIVVCSATAAGLLVVHLAAPQLYETSALGGWMLAFLVFGGFFVRELISLFQQRKEGIIGGVAA